MRWICLLLTVGLCGCGPSSQEPGDAGPSMDGSDAGAPVHTPSTGSDGGPCFGNGSCNEGLICQAGICLYESEADGALGGPCYGNGTCDQGLSCTEGLCTEQGVEPGGEGGACYGNGTCDEGLVCSSDICAASSEGGEEGTEDGPCYGNGTCNEGLSCEEGICVAIASGPFIDLFTITPAIIDEGDIAVVAFSTSGADFCSLSGESQSPAVPLGASGTYEVSPEVTTVYTLSCEGQGGLAEEQRELSVNPAVAITSFEVSPEVIDHGQTAQLSWTTSAAVGCSLSGGIGEVALENDGLAVSPEQTMTFTLTCEGVAGPAHEEVTLTVNPPVEVTSFLADGLSDEQMPIIEYEQAVELSWETKNAVSCALDVDGDSSTAMVPVPIQGSMATPPLLETTTFEISCQGTAGPALSTLTVEVTPPVRILEISATPQTIEYGQSSLLSWTTENAESCTLDDQSGEPPVALSMVSGSMEVTPQVDTVYTLTCDGPSGPVAETIGVFVLPPVRILELSLSDESPSFLDEVTVSFSVENEDDCTLLSQGDGEEELLVEQSSGSMELSITALPNQNHSFTLTCEGPAGPVAETAIAQVQNHSVNGTQGYCTGSSLCASDIDTLSSLAGVNTINGDLYLIGSSRQALELSRLVTVTGSIKVYDNPSLTALSLENLREASSIDLGRPSFFVAGGENPSLTTLGLSHLEQVEGQLILGFYEGLTELSLPRLNSVDGLVIVVLEACAPWDFSGLETVASDLWLVEVRSSTDLVDAFSSLQSSPAVNLADHAWTDSDVNLFFNSQLGLSGDFTGQQTAVCP